MQNYNFAEYWKKRIHFDFLIAVVFAHKNRGKKPKPNRFNAETTMTHLEIFPWLRTHCDV